MLLKLAIMQMNNRVGFSTRRLSLLEKRKSERIAHLNIAINGS